MRTLKPRRSRRCGLLSRSLFPRAGPKSNPEPQAHSAFEFTNSLFPDSWNWKSTFEYHTGRPPAELSWEYSFAKGLCRVAIDGQGCSSCYSKPCDDGYFFGFSIDCRNVLTAQDGPRRYDSCAPETGGMLDIFAWAETDSFTGCPFLIAERGQSIFV